MKKVLLSILSLVFCFTSLADDTFCFGSFPLSWRPVTNAKSYVIRYGVNPTALNMERGCDKATSVTVGGLIPGRTYDFVVFATLTNGSVIPVFPGRKSYTVPGAGRVELQKPSGGPRALRAAHIRYPVEPGKTMTLEGASSLLGPWTNLTSHAWTVSGVFDFQDNESTNKPMRFYRTHTQ